MTMRIASPAGIVIAIILTAFAPSCGDEDERSPALTVEALRNATYPSDSAETGEVSLVDGRFEGEGAYDGGVFALTVSLAGEVGIGDLDGDGADDAAVVLATNGGGSGTFNELVAVLNSGGSVSPVATASLGDRVVIDSISVVPGRIMVDMTTHSVDDPLCCPSVAVSKIYVLEGSALLLLDEVEPYPTAQRIRSVRASDLRTGDCLRDPPGEGIGVYQISVVSCSDPIASARVTRTFEVKRGGSFPGERYLDDQAERECLGADDWYFIPSDISWSVGDRTITCGRTLR